MELFTSYSHIFYHYLSRSTIYFRILKNGYIKLKTSVLSLIFRLIYCLILHIIAFFFQKKKQNSNLHVLDSLRNLKRCIYSLGGFNFLQYIKIIQYLLQFLNSQRVHKWSGQSTQIKVFIINDLYNNWLLPVFLTHLPLPVQQFPLFL